MPYPVATEIIANVVTSPHHLSATMVTGREHRMTEVFARLAPGADLDAARAELHTIYAAMLAAHPEVYKPEDHYTIDCHAHARPDQFSRQYDLVGAVRGLRPAVRDCLLECCQSGAGAHRAPRIGAGRTLGVGSNHERRFAVRCWRKASCCAAAECWRP